MVVQHNLKAMNSNRMLGLTQASQAKSTEKLSSGYKINRAADDAAGLSISEKMRKQIRGLTQASANAQDGISTVQTAEGALNEVQDMLQRMNELAVKAANGTNSENDRSYIQNEIDQLTTEIDRVSETTKFNETYLLKGDRDAVKGFTYSYKTYGATNASDAIKAKDATATMNTDAASGFGAAISFSNTATGAEQNEIALALKNQGITINNKFSEVTAGAAASANSLTSATSVSLNGAAADKYTVSATGTANQFKITNAAGKEVATITVSGGSIGSTDGTKYKVGTESATISAKDVTAANGKGELVQYYDRDGNAISANALGSYFQAIPGASASAAPTVTARGDASEVYDAVGNKTTLDKLGVSATQQLQGALTLSLHVGADATSNNQISIQLDAMSAKGLGVSGLRVDGTDDSNALKAVDTIKEAIQKVSTQRSALGAVQNRLEHTINNLDNVVENTTSAESQIRDTDMATEMVKYSNSNILSQAGQAMLAQANQSNQGVLSLLG